MQLLPNQFLSESFCYCSLFCSCWLVGCFLFVVGFVGFPLFVCLFVVGGFVCLLLLFFCVFFFGGVGGLGCCFKLGSHIRIINTRRNDITSFVYVNVPPVPFLA